MVYTVCERLIKGDADMVDVEKIIVKQLGGENHRCAFFRTVPYIRLRIAALYLPNPTPHNAYFGDLSVSLTPTDEGAVVCVHCKYDPTYPDDFEAAAMTECGIEALCETKSCVPSPICDKKQRLRK
jgi:hypothetical protein